MNKIKIVGLISLSLLILLFVLLRWGGHKTSLKANTPADHNLSIEGLQSILLVKGDSLQSKIDTEQIVEITGYIKEINQLNQRTTIILQGKYGETPYAICDMQDSQKVITDQL